MDKLLRDHSQSISLGKKGNIEDPMYQI